MTPGPSGWSDLAKELLRTLASAGPWPLVVLIIGLAVLILAGFLGTFYLVQRGRRKARVKIGIASIELDGQIEERPPRRTPPRGGGSPPAGDGLDAR